jgi:hypothetical protein
LFSEFGVVSVLDLLDDAITDNDLRGPIMAMPQLDVNRFRLAGSRASDVLRRDFGATARGDGSRPFDLRAALGLRFVGRSVDLALGATLTVAVSEAEPSDLGRGLSGRRCDPLAGPPSLLHVRSLTPPADLNAASRLRAEAPPAGHRRVQSASPRVPAAAANPVRPPLTLGTASAGMPRAASDPASSAQASRNARKPPLSSQPHHRNTSSGTTSSNASGGTVGDRGQLRTSSVSSAGSAAGRRRRRLKGSQRGGSEQGSRRSASPGNNGFENL